MPTGWKPGGHAGVAALFRDLGGRPRKSRPLGTTLATLAVTSCADDNGAGTLRSVISGANDRDTIDLTGLNCGSTIALTQGVIPIYLDTLTIVGRGAGATIIDGNATDRVFAHVGYDQLILRDLTVRNGRNEVVGYKVAGGACVLSYSVAVLDHAAVQDCVAVGEGAYGGGILAGEVKLYTSTVSGNASLGSLLDTLTASYGGGAFAYRGTAAMYYSTVSGNRAVADARNANPSYDTGAGIFADGGGYSARSTISGNETDGTGGGIASHGGFTIANSTISGNSAQKSGGGIFTRLTARLRIVSSTIAGNAAASGGGVYVAGNDLGVDLESTIIADNTAPVGGDIASEKGFVASGSNNLVRNAANATLPGDTRHDDPLLLALASNGGPTLTQALAADSPAIDAGNNVFGLPFDQRGFPRLAGTAPDIGAFERAAPVAVALPVPLSTPLLCLVLSSLLAFAARWRWRRY